MNADEHSVSIAVVPPKAMSQAVHMANIYENAEVARSSGDARPTMTMEMVCSDICKVYAMMTGVELFTNILSSCHTALQVDRQSFGCWSLVPPSCSSDSTSRPLVLGNRLDDSFGLPLLIDFGRSLDFCRKSGSHERAGLVSSIVAICISDFGMRFTAFVIQPNENQRNKL